MAAGWRIAAVGIAFAAYALLSHWLMVNAADRPWAVAVLFGPLVLAVAGTGFQRRQPGLLAACGAGVALLALVVARGGVDDVNRMYVLQYAGIHFALTWIFASTLRPGGQPLISALAESLHHRFTPEMRDYTRWLTRLWALYFVVTVAISFAVYAAAPWSWWSFYANILTPLGTTLLFVGEHVQRYRRHPDFERITLAAAIAAYRRPAGSRAQT
jgi:uncharacterized membrane protein